MHIPIKLRQLALLSGMLLGACAEHPPTLPPQPPVIEKVPVYVPIDARLLVPCPHVQWVLGDADQDTGLSGLWKKERARADCNEKQLLTIKETQQKKLTPSAAAPAPSVTP